MAVRAFPITDVQTWMGHADIATTRKYVHYAPQPDAAPSVSARSSTSSWVRSPSCDAPADRRGTSRASRCVPERPPRLRPSSRNHPTACTRPRRGPRLALSGSQPSSHVDLGFAAPPAGPGVDKCAQAARTLRDAAPWCVQCVAVVGGVAATYEGRWHRGTRAMGSSGRGWSGGAAPVEVAGAGVAGAGRVGVRWSPFTRARTRYRTWM